LIATPGRLIDHIQQNSVDLRSVTVLVLDEADRMLDMGFAPQVERILKNLYPERQTMLFSATMPPDIINLASRYMKLPIQIEIAPSGTAAQDVTQELFIVKEQDKKAILLMLLSQYRGAILVFARTKIKAKRIARMIREKESRVVELHSDRSMSQRQQAMDGFKSGRYRILVATDIASRGIDVSKIELVINHDLPDDIENYVHRIGRTGRAGKTGHAITLATPEQGSEVAQIERMIRKPIPRGRHAKVQTEEFIAGAVAKKAPAGRRPGGGGGWGSKRPGGGGVGKGKGGSSFKGHHRKR
jgi:ATP-dependent RNA helicase RhlE